MGSACTKLLKNNSSAAQQVESNSNTVAAVAPTAQSKSEVTVKMEGKGDKSVETKLDISSHVGESDTLNNHEYSVCKTEDLHENEMKVFDVGERQVLIVKEKGQVYAMGAKCTHFGAPLNTGIFCKGKVYCPWHGACFNSKTGDIEEFPGLDPIPVYPVRVDLETNDVIVNVTGRKVLNLNNHGVEKPLCKAIKDNKEIVVIIGSGAAGHSCAETLRQEGFTGRVVIITKDQNIPYDRTKLSKAMNLDGSKLALRSQEYYKKGDIEIIHQVSVQALDVEAKTVLLSNGESMHFSNLVIATGGRPRPIPCPGTHLTNVFLLRTPQDANRIESVVNKERHVVIVGTSFIGMEVAAYLVDKAESVTVIGRSPTPFAHVFGPLIGKRLQELHQEKGVKFVVETEIAELIGDEHGNLTEVALTSGQTLRADLLLAGLGVVPSTDFLRASEVVLDSKGYVPVDEFMRTNIEGVYAAGDIASFPIRKSAENPHQLANVGHWQMALHHGRTVALSIMGRSRPIYETAVPFFWSSMFGKSVRYCGFAPDFDDIIIHGDLDNLKFAGFICKSDTVQAVVTLNFDPLAIQFSALIGQGKTLSKIDVINDPKSWTHALQED